MESFGVKVEPYFNFIFFLTPLFLISYNTTPHMRKCEIEETKFRVEVILFIHCYFMFLNIFLTFVCLSICLNYFLKK